MSTEYSSLKPCFVICPIGPEGSRTRFESDDLLERLIQPVAKEHGFHASRNIDHQRPGEITTKIIEDIDRSELIVCDITGHNPNVMYELAVAHAWDKPYIILRRDDLPLPFDINSQNVISFKLDSMAAPERARQLLSDHFKAFIAGEAIFENILTRYQNRKRVLSHGTPQDLKILNIEEEIGLIKKQIDGLVKIKGKVFLGGLDDSIRRHPGKWVVINGVSEPAIKKEFDTDEDFLK